jgi:arylsulfatase A-like enzyme
MAERRPNIIWYCTDQQRFDTIHGLGNQHINTPNLDRFMESAVTFTHAHCQAPICTASRSSFLTGMYPSHVRNTRNGNGTVSPDVEERLITRKLADDGYDCGLVGKLHLAGGINGQESRAKDGYRFFHYSHAPRSDWKRRGDYYEWIEEQGANADDVLEQFDERRRPRPAGDMPQGGLWEPTPEQDNAPPELHQTTWCTTRAIEFIDEDRDEGQPWLISLNPFDPHPPHDAPWEFYRRYDPDTLPAPLFRESDVETQNQISDAGVDFQTSSHPPEHWGFPKVKASYYAMIELIDEQFGRLLDHLDSIGERENTIVIFMSDHGETLGDHGLALKGCRFSEGLVRVPLMISWPGRFEQGVISDALVELTDIVPTFMEVAGLAAPQDMHGKSLLPILTGESPAGEHRDFVWSEFADCIMLPDRSRATMYRNRRWKLVVYHGNDVGELYDMENDPDEFENLWDSSDHAGTKAELVLKSFNRTVMTQNLGPDRAMRY